MGLCGVKPRSLNPLLCPSRLMSPEPECNLSPFGLCSSRGALTAAAWRRERSVPALRLFPARSPHPSPRPGRRSAQHLCVFGSSGSGRNRQAQIQSCRCAHRLGKIGLLDVLWNCICFTKLETWNFSIPVFIT